MGSFRTFLQEGLRLAATHTNGDRTAKVYRDAEWEEHRVKHFVDGVHQHKADYHTNDKEEAHSHAKSWAHKTGVHAESVDEAKVAQPIKGHHYHKKSDAELHYIVKDAGSAAKAMQGHSPHSETKYLDQVNDASTVLHYRSKGGKREVEKPFHDAAVTGNPRHFAKEEVMVNEKITDSKEALEKAIAVAERKAQKAQTRENSSYVEALKKALRRIKGKKNLTVKDVGVTSEDTEKHEPSHAEEGKVKRAKRFKYKKKFDKQNESTELVTELSKKVLSSYRTKAMGQIKAGKGPLKGKDEKRFNGVARSVKEDQLNSELDAIHEADTAFHSQDEFAKHAHARGHVVRTVLRGANAHIHAKHLGTGKTHGLFDVKKEHGVYSTSPLHVDEQFDGDELVLKHND